MRYSIVILVGFLFIGSIYGQSSLSYKEQIKEHRQSYKTDFLKDQRSPFYHHPQDLKYLRFYRAKKKYRIKCSFNKTPNAPPFDMATYSGMIKKYRQYGILTFSFKGKKHQLAVYQNLKLLEKTGYEDYLFLPFKDLTNGKKSYGGGRYLNLKTGDLEKATVFLDFNKNYNPWCTFSDGYNCPVPPRENHLSVAIKAGEKNYGKKKRIK